MKSYFNCRIPEELETTFWEDEVRRTWRILSALIMGMIASFARFQYKLSELNKQKTIQDMNKSLEKKQSGALRQPAL